MVYTVERLTDNDNFECADPGLVKKGPSALSKHKTPVGKLIRRQKIDYMTYLYDCESPKLEFLRYHLSFYLYVRSSYFVVCENHVTAHTAVTNEIFFNILSFGYAGMFCRQHP